MRVVPYQLSYAATLSFKYVRPNYFQWNFPLRDYSLSAKQNLHGKFLVHIDLELEQFKSIIVKVPSIFCREPLIHILYALPRTIPNISVFLV
jgi:hypothetical protein